MPPLKNLPYINPTLWEWREQGEETQIPNFSPILFKPKSEHKPSLSKNETPLWIWMKASTRSDGKDRSMIPNPPFLSPFPFLSFPPNRNPNPKPYPNARRKPPSGVGCEHQQEAMMEIDHDGGRTQRRAWFQILGQWKRNLFFLFC